MYDTYLLTNLALRSTTLLITTNAIRLKPNCHRFKSVLKCYWQTVAVIFKRMLLRRRECDDAVSAVERQILLWDDNRQSDSRHQLIVRTLLTFVSEPAWLTEALSLWIWELRDCLTLTVTTAVRVHSTLVCTHQPSTSSCRLLILEHDIVKAVVSNSQQTFNEWSITYAVITGSVCGPQQPLNYFRYIWPQSVHESERR